MSMALAKRDDEIVITNEQMDLVKKTIAVGATDAQLKMFLYDCQRRGVHPLDKLLHFTLRSGKYTPVVSIDLLRSRAAESGEYAGNEDAVFNGVAKVDGFEASVTVYRLVQGQRCAFSATARWSEYCPQSGQDHMWRKMPHTMLAKVAESLALRKGFPQQLGGLYERAEMEQADEPNQAPPLRSPASRDEQCEQVARDVTPASVVSSTARPSAPVGMIQPGQKKAILDLAGKRSIEAEELAHDTYGVSVDSLTTSQAGLLITELQKG